MDEKTPLNLEGKTVSFRMYQLCNPNARYCSKDNYYEFVKFQGRFIGWGVDSEELEQGVLRYTVALVLLDTGEVKNPKVENIINFEME